MTDNILEEHFKIDHSSLNKFSFGVHPLLFRDWRNVQMRVLVNDLLISLFKILVSSNASIQWLLVFSNFNHIHHFSSLPFSAHDFNVCKFILCAVFLMNHGLLDLILLFYLFKNLFNFCNKKISLIEILKP